MNSPPLLKHSTDRQTGKPTDRQGDRLRQDYTDKRWTTLSTVAASLPPIFSLFSFVSYTFLFRYFHKISRTHAVCSPMYFSPVIRFAFLVVFSRSHSLSLPLSRFFHLFLSFFRALSLSFFHSRSLNTCSQTRAHNRA